MDSAEVFLLGQAVVIGTVGGVGLTLTTIYSRRGPMIYPVYAAIVCALTLLLTRYSALSFSTRFWACLAGFLVANVALYPVVSILAQRQRRELVTQGRLPESALKSSIGMLGHSWRMGFLVGIGAIISAAAAFVSA